MALTDITVTGTLDETQGIIVPNNSSTWADLTTWDAWSSWTATPADPLVWITDPLDLGEPQTFNLNIETTANGTVSYTVFTSETGVFGGEETELDIDPDDDGIGSFYGRFVIVAVKVSAEGGLNTLEGVSIKANNRTIDLTLNDINTSTLPGTASSRTLSTDRNLSGIINMQITPKEVTAYDVDAYVTNTPTSTQLIPKIINKQNLTFNLVGIDNQPRDGIVDITIKALPEQYMVGNNLRSR
jgi:hypothetical protein